MALPPAEQNDAFIREVDEEYRRDQLAQAWNRYGRWLLIGIGLFLIAVAAGLWWHEEQKRRAGQAGEQYLMALEKISAANVAGAEPMLDKAVKDGGDGYEELAKLTRAAAAARINDTARAAQLYSEVAKDDGAPQPFRDLAAVQEILVRYDGLKPDDAIARLKPLAVPGNPYFATAGELLAITYMRQGKRDLAGPLFAQVARDPGTPPSIRGRASQMASMLGVNVFPGAGTGLAR